ncbi:MAG: putative RNA methyltransferase [Pontibacterium sp.]
MQLCCPVCNLPLHLNDKRLSCDNHHSFDRARQGYWNLLLANKKRSKDPGDNAEMIAARTAFLDTGHYQPIAERVANGLSDYLTADGITQADIADIGCGEGYYTQHIHNTLIAQGLNPNTLGLDISKHAVKAACKRSKAIKWTVASGSQVPVTPHSLDAISLMFCRLMPEAMHHALKPNGLLLVAWPNAQHLIELRERIYQEVRTSSYNPTALLSERFDLAAQETLNFKIHLTNATAISALLTMTPHSQRMPAGERDALAQCEDLKLTVDVNLGWYRAK